MMATLTSTLLVLASEAHGIPGSDWRAKAAVPIGLVLFIGSVYMLVRANLGTRRGYLVMATSLWGFMVIYALFWTFGAPGTPPATGPQNLPGQELDAYEDTWRPFAGDSLVAGYAEYSVAKSYPEGFSEDPAATGQGAEFEGEAASGVDDILTFFSTAEGPLETPPLGPTWGFVEGSAMYAEATNGRPIIAAQFAPTYQIAVPQPDDADPDAPVLTENGDEVADGESNVAPEGTEIGAIVPDAEPVTLFAYFDAGSPLFPSFVMLGIVTVLFGFHALLLARDENRERRERSQEVTTETEQPVPASV